MDLQDVIDKAAEILQTSADHKELSQCERMLEDVLTSERENVGVWFMVATTYMRQGRWSLAARWLAMVLDKAPDMIEAMNNYAFTLEQLGDHDTARKYFRKAYARKPEDAALANNISTGYINNGTPEKALKAANEALAIDPDFVDAHWNKGLALLEMGQWREAWEEHAWGLKLNATSSQTRKIRHYQEENKHPWWEGTAGKSVVIYSEQGVGDEILAVSMLRDAINDAPNLVFESHPRLVNIMRHNFPDIPVYGTRKQQWQKLAFPEWTKIDAKCPIFELGQFYRTKDEDFPRKPYLKPFDQYVEEYKSRLAALSDKPKIAIAWQGGSHTTRADLRSIPLMGWKSLLENVDAEFISLQYDDAAAPGTWAPIVESFNKDYGFNIHHWEEDVNDLDLCYGGLIHALDLVITVNTSLVHACGAFGVNCWVLTPSKPAWRYGVKGDHMQWYGDHVRQFRQKGDDWKPVMARVEKELQEFICS